MRTRGMAPSCLDALHPLASLAFRAARQAEGALTTSSSVPTLPAFFRLTEQTPRPKKGKVLLLTMKVKGRLASWDHSTDTPPSSMQLNF